MTRRTIGRLVVATTLVLIMVAPVALAGEAQLRSEVKLIEATDQGVVVLLSLTNITDEDVFVISYETALNRLERDLFRIEREGEVIPYLGVMVMRAGPTAESWIRIAPGATVSAKVNLAEGYDLSRDGEYSIEYEASAVVLSGIEESMLPVIDPSTGKGAVIETPRTYIRSAAISVELSGVPFQVGRDELDRDQAELSKHSYLGCTTSERNAINSALSCARTSACDAADYCHSYGCSSWYYDWFGNCSYSSTVCSRFDDTCYYLTTCNMTFTCDGPYCEAGVIAYVYQNRPCQIWICPDFFVYTYFQCHAITHEANHWTGTEDWVYGESDCRWLADYYPSYAADNADNYAYAADYCPW